MCLLVYQIRYSPMKESLSNRLENLNEVTVLTITLLMTCFTDYTPNEMHPPLVQRETNQNIGWLIISITSLFMVTYMFLIVKGILKGLKAKLHPHFARWCTARNLKKAKPSPADYQISKDCTKLEENDQSLIEEVKTIQTQFDYYYSNHMN